MKAHLRRHTLPKRPAQENRELAPETCRPEFLSHREDVHAICESVEEAAVLNDGE
jgi:hypothetical protein